jgi:hypothetical protein
MERHTAIRSDLGERKEGRRRKESVGRKVKEGRKAKEGRKFIRKDIKAGRKKGRKFRPRKHSELCLQK